MAKFTVNKRRLSTLLSRDLKNKVRINRVTAKIRANIAEYIGNIVRQSYGYQAMINDPDIIGAIGLPEEKIESVLDDMVTIFQTDVFARFDFKTASGTGGKQVLLELDIGLVEESYDRVLAIPDAEYYSYNTLEIGDEPQTFSYLIPWLKWFLTDGYVRIDDFVIEYGSFAQSRSGHAIMVPQIGGHWVLPEPFRGASSDNNFVTIALREGIQELIDNLGRTVFEGVS